MVHKIITGIKRSYYEMRMNHCQKKISESDNANELSYWVEEMLDWNVKLLAL